MYLPQFRAILKNELVVPEDFTAKGVRSLSPNEIQCAEQIYDWIDRQINRNQIMIVYRGEKKAHLKKKLASSGQNIDYGQLLNRLFYFGDKAKFYFSQKRVPTQGSTPQCISDTSSATFEFIFRKLSLIVTKSIENPSSERIQKIDEFCQNATHKAFVSYFRDEANLPDFLHRNADSSDSSRAERVRDYYLFLLHNFGGGGIAEMSFFVSTSVNPETAMSFAGSKHQKSGKSVVFVHMIPQPFYKHGIGALEVKCVTRDFRYRGIPIYDREFYPEQEEFSVKGALFPNFMLGLYDLELQKFVVNPHMFGNLDQSINGILFRGIPIDQDDFHESIRNTGYYGYVSRSWHGKYSDVLSLR